MEDSCSNCYRAGSFPAKNFNKGFLDSLTSLPLLKNNSKLLQAKEIYKDVENIDGCIYYIAGKALAYATAAALSYYSIISLYNLFK